MNTIVLSKDKFNSDITYYLTSATKEQCDLIENLEKKEANEALRKLVKNDKASLIAVGDGMKLISAKIEPILALTEQRQYRCYDIPLERQEKMASTVDLCSDTKTCWQSALRAIGYRQASGLNTPAYYTAYALIWKEVN